MLDSLNNMSSYLHNEMNITHTLHNLNESSN